jgi:hypothetical protein
VKDQLEDNTGTLGKLPPESFPVVPVVSPEAALVPSFELEEALAAVQRCSYAHENRCLKPNPVIITQTKNSRDVTPMEGGTVTAMLGNIESRAQHLIIVTLV